MLRQLHNSKSGQKEGGREGGGERERERETEWRTGGTIGKLAVAESAEPTADVCARLSVFALEHPASIQLQLP